MTRIEQRVVVVHVVEAILVHVIGENCCFGLAQMALWCRSLYSTVACKVLAFAKHFVLDCLTALQLPAHILAGAPRIVPILHQREQRVHWCGRGGTCERDREGGMLYYVMRHDMCGKHPAGELPSPLGGM